MRLGLEGIEIPSKIRRVKSFLDDVTISLSRVKLKKLVFFPEKVPKP